MMLPLSKAVKHQVVHVTSRLWCCSCAHRAYRHLAVTPIVHTSQKHRCCICRPSAADAALEAGGSKSHCCSLTVALAAIKPVRASQLSPGLVQKLLVQNRHRSFQNGCSMAATNGYSIATLCMPRATSSTARHPACSGCPSKSQHVNTVWQETYRGAARVSWVTTS
jgi:hypothetical protein